MVPTLIFAIIVFSIILIKSADILISALSSIARSTHTGVFALSALILAIGTSFPELFVGITSAIEKAPSLTFGVVVGSNIANIAVVAGLTSIIVGKVNVQGEIIKRDVLISFIAAILPLVLILDGKLGRVDGLVLLSVYLAYATSFFKGQFMEIGEKRKEEAFFYRIFQKINHIDGKTTKEYGKLFIGVAILLFSSDQIIKFSKELAVAANIPVFVIGLVLLALGTSLPEFAFSLRTIEDHHPSMFFGNLLGSTIANSTLILGVTSLIEPIKIGGLEEQFFAISTFVIVYLLFWFFIRSKRTLERKEGFVLLLIYFIFVALQFV